MKLRKIFITVVVVAAVGFGAFQAYLYSIKIYASEPVFQTSQGAIDGYDAVAYFKEAKPVAGKAEFSTEWNGARWQFSSADNLAEFQASPERYAPQYGGYCAFAVANGYTAKSDPSAWHIEAGKLYLNFDASVREQWLARRSEFIAAALRNWPGVIQD